MDGLPFAILRYGMRSDSVISSISGATGIDFGPVDCDLA